MYVFMYVRYVLYVLYVCIICGLNAGKHVSRHGNCKYLKISSTLGLSMEPRTKVKGSFGSNAGLKVLSHLPV